MPAAITPSGIAALAADVAGAIGSVRRDWHRTIRAHGRQRQGEAEQGEAEQRLLEGALRQVGGGQVGARREHGAPAPAASRGRRRSAPYAVRASRTAIAPVSPAKPSIRLAPLTFAVAATIACGPSG